jgi:hypothetical protein
MCFGFAKQYFINTNVKSEQCQSVSEFTRMNTPASEN